MKSQLKAGVCVSCGRESGRYYRACPYCGEQVWQPGWRRASCALVLAAPPLALAALALAARPDFTALAAKAAGAPVCAGLLFATGAGLLLMPCKDDDLVVSSRSELVRWQAQAVAGALLMGAHAAGLAVCLAFGRTVGAATWLAALALAACLLAAPLFFRIPCRALVASALIAGAIALG